MNEDNDENKDNDLGDKNNSKRIFLLCFDKNIPISFYPENYKKI
jgi:hypothetical protein